MVNLVVSCNHLRTYVTALRVSIEKVHGLQNAEKDDLTFPEWWALIEIDSR